MAILSINDYLASARHLVGILKTATITTVAANFSDVMYAAGNPGAGTLAGTSTTAGVVPVDTDAGFPRINNFADGAQGYLTKVIFGNSVIGRMRIVDLLWKGGAYSYNASVTLSSQPSFASRIHNGDYGNTELWVEGVTAMTGNLSVTIGYTNQDGVSGKTTGTVATGVAPIVGRMMPIPLAAGDNGLQQVNSVTATVSTAGTFNVLVVRPLWEGYVGVAGGGDVHDMLKTGCPEVFQDSALMIMIAPSSTSSGVIYANLEISSK